MNFKDLKTGEEFSVSIKDIKLKKINTKHYAIAKAPAGHEVMQKITSKEYRKLKAND